MVRRKRPLSDALSTIKQSGGDAVFYGSVYALCQVSLFAGLGLSLLLQDTVPLAFLFGSAAFGASALLILISGRLTGPSKSPHAVPLISVTLILCFFLFFDFFSNPVSAETLTLFAAAVGAATYTVLRLCPQRFSLTRALPLFVLLSLLSGSTTFYARVDPVLLDKIVPAGFIPALALASAGLILSQWLCSRKRSPGDGGPAPKAILVVSTVLLLSLLAFLPSWCARTDSGLSGPAGQAQGTLDGEKRDNIILIVLDTVRAGSMELFGHTRETMPNLTSFAKRHATHVAGIQAPAPATLPTHASIFTGHYPHSHGAHKPFLNDPDPPIYAYPIDDRLQTLAEILGRHGFTTTGIAANFGVLSGFGISRGFTDFDVRESDLAIIRRVSPVHRAMFHTSLPLGTIQRLNSAILGWFPSFDPLQPPYRTAEEITDLALDFLDHRTVGPFFLFLNYFDAHDPYLPPRSFRKYSAGYPQPAWRGFPGRKYYRGLAEGIPLPEEDARHAQNLYEDELTFLDTHLARILDRVSGSDLAGDTVLIVTSDHGESFMEHGVMLHSSQVCPHQIGVPLIIKLPGQDDTDRQPLSESFQHVDILPSILDHLGFAVPEGCQGQVWGSGRDYSLAEVFVHYKYINIPWLNHELFSVTRQGIKTVFTRSSSGILCSRYELSTDGEEQAPKDTEISSLDPLVQAIFEERNAVIDHRRAGGGSEGNSAETEALLDRLRRLGYVE